MGNIPSLENINKDPSIDERINNLLEIVFRINKRNEELKKELELLKKKLNK